jgi:hypothetical protein
MRNFGPAIERVDDDGDDGLPKASGIAETVRFPVVESLPVEVETSDADA